MDQILQPVRWLPDWVRNWAIRLLERQVERREAPRRMVAKLTAHYCEGTGAAGHRRRDISASGAFIFAEFKWMPGTILTMTLQLEGQVVGSGSLATTVVRARVVREVPNGVGVQFLYADKAERQSLADFLHLSPRLNHLDVLTSPKPSSLTPL
jgi:PilZ domain